MPNDADTPCSPRFMMVRVCATVTPRLHDRANIEQTSSRRQAISTCILNAFAWRFLDVCSIV